MEFGPNYPDNPSALDVPYLETYIVSVSQMVGGYGLFVKGL